MKTTCLIRQMVVAALLLVMAAAAAGETNETETAVSVSVPVAPLVYVIPVEGMIERGLLHVMRRSLKEALDEQASAIVLDMNTPGGRVDVTEALMRMLIELPPTLQTFTYINKDALSAGALIAISTEHIYMAPGSRIGASAIVGPGGNIEEGDLKEKHVSALVALVRAAAEARGHDPDLIETMIRRELEYEIDEEVIVKEGQLLTLSGRDATRLVNTNTTPRPLLAKAIVADIEELLAVAGFESPVIRTIKITRAERVARWIETFAFLFLAGGLLGIYIEFRTPGFGLPGIVGGLLLAIFFWGHRIAGLSGDIELILFLVGALLLLLEILVIPGFGLPGITGISLMIIAIFFSMAAPLPGAPWFQIPAFDVQRAFINLGFAFTITLVAGVFATRFLPHTIGFKRLILETVLSNNPPASADDSGQPAAAQNVPSLVGATGTAITALRPSGYASVNGQRLNVVAEGNFMDAGEALQVVEVRGNHIVVGKAPTAKEPA